MKETWSAMRKIIAPIMLVALATTGMTVAGSTAAHADTASPVFVTFEPNDTWPTRTDYPWNFWGDVTKNVTGWGAPNNDGAQNAGGIHTGYSQQMSNGGQDGPAVVYLQKAGYIFTSTANPVVSFDFFSKDDARDITVNLSTTGTTSADVTATVSVPQGWSHQSVDFSTVSGWSGSAGYTVLYIAPGTGDTWMDNLAVNGGSDSASSSPSPSPSASSTAPAAPVVASIKLDSADLGPEGVYSVGNGWWNEGSGSRSVVKYLAAGGTYTLHYTVLDTTGTAVSGAQVTLATSGGADSATSGSRTGTTDADGKVTFTFTNTTDNSAAEQARSDASTWSGPVGGELKWDAVPYISGTSTHTQCYDAGNASTCNRDRLWGHVVASASASASPTAPAGPVVASIKLDSADLGPAGVYSVGNGWWNEGSGSRSVVKYLAAGGTYTLHYTVLDTTGTAVSGAQVTLATAGDAEGATTGSRTGTTDANGKVTFTFTNATANSAAEYPRSDTSNWSDPELGGTVIWNAIPYISGTSTHTQCYDAGNASTCNRDRLWGHVVSTANYSKPAVTLVRLLASDKTAMTDHSDWYTDNAANRSMVKFVTVGNKMVLRYQVTKGGTPVAGRTVTLAAQSAGNNASFTGSLTAVTNSNGIATFSLTAVAPNGAENRPVAPSSMNYWDQSHGDVKGTQTEVDFTPSVSALDTPVMNYDRVWAHIVAAPSSQAVPAAPYQVTAQRSAAKKITVNWNAATEDGAANTGYEVTLTPKTGSPVVATAAASATSLEVTVVTVTGYTASVKAINSAGKSAATAASGPVTPGATAPKAPNAPTMGTTPLKGVDALWFPFSPSATDSGATASGFQYSTDGGTTWFDVTYDTASVDASGAPDATRRGNVLFLYNLPSGKSYSVQVRAVNSFGAGAASSAKVAATATAPTGKPVLTTLAYAGTTLSIGFTGIAAAANGGSPITGYEYSLNNGTNWIKVKADEVKANKIVVTGLAASLAPFTVTMRGSNGLNSASAVAKTVSAITVTPKFAVVGGKGKVTLTVTAITATANTSNSAVVKYQYTTNNGSTWSDVTAGSATVIVATKGTVSVKVRAVTSVGAGPASAAAPALVS